MTETESGSASAATAPSPRPGRPRRSSATTIEEAAGELFLEQGYAATSVEQIAQRAGVSRATVFNYVTSKSDLLWLGVDAALDDLESELAGGASVADALHAVAARTGAGRIPLALSQSGLMQADAELLTSGMLRLARLAALLRAAFAAETGSPSPARGDAPAHDAAIPALSDPLARAVDAYALAGAVSAGWRAWASAGTGRDPLSDYLDRALARLASGIRPEPGTRTVSRSARRG